MIPKDTKGTAYIFEYKWESKKGGKRLEKLTEEAVNQIKEKKYKEGFSATYSIGNVVCIGIGIKGKELKMLLLE